MDYSINHDEEEGGKGMLRALVLCDWALGGRFFNRMYTIIRMNKMGGGNTAGSFSVMC